MKALKIIGLIIGAGVLACVGLAVLASLGRSSQTGQSAAPVATAVQHYAVNQDVRVGDVRWKVIEVSDLGKQLTSKEEFSKPKDTAGKFIRVRVEIENVGTEPVSFTSVDVVDGKGRTSHNVSDVDVLMHIPDAERCVLDNLNPNLPKVCQVIFELPADAAGIQLVVGDLKAFGADDVKIDLGL